MIYVIDKFLLMLFLMFDVFNDLFSFDVFGLTNLDNLHCCLGVKVLLDFCMLIVHWL